MRNLFLVFVLALGGAQAHAAKVELVQNLEAKMRRAVDYIGGGVVAANPTPTIVGRITGSQLDWYSSTLPISKATLVQVALSDLCTTSASERRGCLVNEGRMITSYQVVNEGSSKAIYETAFMGEPVLHSFGNQILQMDSGPTIYTWQQKILPSEGLGWGFCALTADLSGSSAHFIIGGRHVSGLGELHCLGLDGVSVKQDVSMTMDSFGLGLGASKIDHMGLAAPVINVTKSIDDLMGRYYILDGRVQIFIAGVGAGVGLRVSNGVAILPLVLEGTLGMGLEAAVDFNWLDIAKVAPAP